LYAGAYPLGEVEIDGMLKLAVNCMLIWYNPVILPANDPIWLYRERKVSEEWCFIIEKWVKL
jgi:hypothetical protein